TGSGPVAQAVGVSSLVVTAELQAVISLYPTKVLRPVVGLIRAGGDGIALHATDISAIAQVVEIDIRHAEIGRVEWSGVHAQGLGIDVVVDGNNLREALEAEAALQNLVVTNIDGVAHTCHLGARRSDGIEQVGR